MVGGVLDDDVEGVSFDEEAAGVVADEDRGGLQVQEGHWHGFGLYGEVEHVGCGDQSDAAV